VIVVVFIDTGTDSESARLEAKESPDIAVETVEANDKADVDGDDVNIANETNQLKLDNCRVLESSVE